LEELDQEEEDKEEEEEEEEEEDDCSWRSQWITGREKAKITPTVPYDPAIRD